MAVRRVDASRTLASLARAERSIRFGVARGLTWTAKEAEREAKAAIPQRFDRPTAFTKNAVAIAPATKERLVARVFVKDIQAGYLRGQETGGVERPKPGSPVVIAVGQRTNAYGNIPRGAIERARARKDVFAVGKGQRLPPGLYQRIKRGRGKARRAGLKLLVAFEQAVRYRPRFGFRKIVVATARAKGPKIIAASILDALGEVWAGPGGLGVRRRGP